ncbi:MAG: hypothetical protein IPM37_09620 [Hahellaceae bacterium]|nr:hypothetical protein [Hahellaceae bacterium]
MKNKAVQIALVLGVIVSVGLWWGHEDAISPVETVAADTPQPDSAVSAPNDTPPAVRSGASATYSDRASDEMVALSAGLRDKYLTTITHAKIQVHVLEKMMDLLKSVYGADWPSHMEELIRLTFPEWAEALLLRFQNLQAYYEWSKDARFDLAAMSDQDRRQTMWERRKALFGDDALIIWQGQLRTEQMQDVVKSLNEATSMPLAEKMDTYFSQLQSIYQDEAPAAISRHRQEVMDHFLTVDAVQQNLHGLSADARHQHLRQLREKVGLDNDALNRWDQLDAERDQRWLKGKDYMQKRNKLAQTLVGAALDDKLQSLQNSEFGEEADIIRNEEASGYFRYEGEQQYGIN